VLADVLVGEPDSTSPGHALAPRHMPCSATWMAAIAVGSENEHPRIDNVDVANGWHFIRSVLLLSHKILRLGREDFYLHLG
jgi:hypothetical protein